MNTTTASVKNIHKQKQLELELVEIERRWYLELKSIARERLRVIRDLQKIADMRRKLTYFAATLRGPSLRQYTEREFYVMNEEKEVKKKFRKYEFTVDPLEKVNLHLPAVTGLSGGEGCAGNGEIHIVTLEDVLERNRNGRLEKLKVGMHKKHKTKKIKRKKRLPEGDIGQNGRLSPENSLSSGDQTLSSSGGETVLYGNKRKTPNLGKLDFSKKSASLANLPSIGEGPLYIKTSHKHTH
ncbi:uncharacterized protein LOC121371778 [Gigantopelta aegis]|uniref:uncharacterized protein LOC121371778 n=1 Tax=Gigantopelta aegis TaxID=1735272 RepID=UPI001B88C312|nr:uncharacterized protein LOC121371778 [Gigantopelta aegis]XP_041353847.1 uncharacterized protein LOC121371778 [Gigantopelta aegis]